MSSLEEFGFDKGLLSYFEVRSRHASEVSQTLVLELRLSNSRLQFLMKFIQINGKVLAEMEARSHLGWIVRFG